jgi:hypothetical protein
MVDESRRLLFEEFKSVSRSMKVMVNKRGVATIDENEPS